MEITETRNTIKEPISFYQLFNGDTENIQFIEIPAIQRDFAQGRQSTEIKRIRKQFLEVLYEALVPGEMPVKSLQLDFIYGSINNMKLIPLDGQQRITTLFLLHWYIGIHERVSKSKLSFLNNFSYHTRYSSEKFCTFLNEIENVDFNKVNKLSEYLQDQYAFMHSWKKDPTVASMLVMLDSIHEKFNHTTNLWESLVDTFNPTISFYFLSLEELKMTDSLYVKMNSRGKPLTEFEHFKAYFQDVIKEVCDEQKVVEISQKFDGRWTDTFWSFRGDNDIIDEEFMRYFRFISEVLAWKQNIEVDYDNDCFDLTDKIYKSKNNIEFLEKALDAWSDIQIDPFFNKYFQQQYLSFKDFREGKVCIFNSELNYFKSCCNNNGNYYGRNRAFSLNEIIMLYGVVYYLMNKDKVNETDFIERLRILRNLVFNSQFEIREKAMSFILADVETLIFSGIINQEDRSFNKLQKEEEIAKIEWRLNHQDLVNKLNFMEDHPLLRGAVSIIDYNDHDSLSKRVETFYTIFPSSGAKDYITLRQVLLSLGDYSQSLADRYAFGGNNDGTWRDMLTRSQQRGNFIKTQNFLNQLLDNLIIAIPIKEQFEKLVNSYLEVALKDWRYYIVKYKHMRAGSFGMYYWKDDTNKPYEMLMMNTSSSLGGKHWDPFHYTIYMDQSDVAFQLEEYGANLYINKYDCFVKSRQDHWSFIQPDGTEFYNLKIPQNESGIDVEDRIEQIIKFLKEEKLPTDSSKISEAENYIE